MFGSRNSDAHWERYGQVDPYFGVIDDDRFRSANLDRAALDRFFASGELHVDHLLATIRARLAPGFCPANALDFGCGVGRLVIPLSALATEVAGVDVSPSMLAEARKNCAARGIANARFFTGLDALPAGAEFDLIHSFIVFQHIPVARGERTLERLLQLLAPGGVGALHFVYHAPGYARLVHWILRNIRFAGNLYNLLIGESLTYPVMHSNFYDLNRLFRILQAAGCGNVYAEPTLHKRNAGVMLYFQKQVGL